MPNYCRNLVTLEGDLTREAQLLDYVRAKVPDEDSTIWCLSFESILPTPKELLDDNSINSYSLPMVYSHMYSYLRSLETSPDLIERTKRDYYESILSHDLDDNVNVARQARNAVYSNEITADPHLGKLYLERMERCGALDWYDWRCRNWSTKWDAIEPQYDPDHKQFRFTTAWRFPLLVFEKISTEYPEICFDCMYADQANRTYGHHLLSNGMVIPSAFIMDPEKEHLYEALWGDRQEE